MDGVAIDHDYMHAKTPMSGVDQEAWVLALNGDGVFSPGFVAAVEAAGWRWMTLPDARGRIVGARSRRIALLSVGHFTAATYDLIRFVTDVLDLPIVVFSPAESVSNVCESLRAGADDCISVPYAPEEAVARLNSVLNGRYRVAARTRRHLRVVCRHPGPTWSGRGGAGGGRR